MDKNKKNVLIFGASGTGRRLYDEIHTVVNIIGWLDNSSEKWGTEIFGIPVLGNMDAVKKCTYDEIYIASLTGYDIIREQLLSVGVEPSKINSSFVDVQVKARINFLRDYAEKVVPERDAAVAEGGVFQGEFAKIINECFPTSALYLFDTFEGFDKRDVSVEAANNFSIEKENHLNITSEGLVLSKLPHPERAVIRKGYFPETSEGLENLTFKFVNLDFDLYNPILAGLRFFYPRMIRGGVLLVHDYFNPGYKGVEQAVADYEKECDIRLLKLPIGDHCSIAIVKE